MHRNVHDFLERDMNMFTLPRATIGYGCITLGTLGFACALARLIPVGQFGIKRVSQTQFFHSFGYTGLIAAGSVSSSIFYCWYQSTTFFINKFYRHAILQERNWIHEFNRQNPTIGEYFFSDVPNSCDENFPDVARQIAAGLTTYSPEWAKQVGDD